MNHSKLITIAIADDHSTYRTSLVDYVVSNGGNIRCIIEADNGKELLEKLAMVEELPDICILDISMPVLNGHDTMAAISQKWKSLKVLAFSMHDHEYAVISMLRNGARGYLLKHGHPNEIIEAIKSMAEHGYYHSEIMKDYPEKMKRMPEIKDKELEFLKLCCEDAPYNDIAKKMFVSPRTLENYRETLFRKLHVKSRMGLAQFAIQTGIVFV